ncbi:SDR family NAD(P)-dependent oxidoreductase [Thermospira aquatica]|uniref:SDR family NAD(P)-dependent oxidoreductase n=1 Tax=Thermospira aquatica TaxID=2828656 RepID=A0AAX3BG03_9SPIR|nr:SDR family NAD(P)-dependent oxidoreductase [Thermospira aquatica]URA11159.1 SDR family NAD(P)-dependent oxidoreductase [Thermospira aquatica]
MSTRASSIPKRWKPRWVLITGSSQGLGKSLAFACAREGFSLILAARRQEILEAVSQEITNQYQVSVHTIMADLSTPEGVDTLWQWCKRQQIWPDILINNAGRGLFGCFEDQPERDLHHLLYLNMESLTLLCHRFGPKMMENHGIIVNVSSLVGLIPTPYFSVYSATKSYVLHFSRALAREWKHKGISVCCLVPGYMRTGFDTNAAIENSSYLQVSRSLGKDPDKVANYALPRILKRKTIIYASTGDTWLALFLGLVPVSLRSLIAKIFLKRFAEKTS